MGAGLGFNGTAASQKVKAITISPTGVVYAGSVFTRIQWRDRQQHRPLGRQPVGAAGWHRVQWWFFN